MTQKTARHHPDRHRRAAWRSWAAVVLGLDIGVLCGLVLATAAARPAAVTLTLAMPVLLVALAILLQRRRVRPPGPDGLTGLAGPAVLRGEVAMALADAAPDRPPAVIKLELEGFAAVRDTLGATEGKDLLRQAAGRLVSSARADDLVVHLGGAEFAVLQREGLQPEAAARFAGRLVRDLSRPYALHGKPLICGAVAGIAVAAPGIGVGEMLNRARTALQRAHAEGQGTARFFEPGMDAALTARHALEGALRQAAAAEDFVLHYQPIFDTDSRRLRGFEALLRWNHPDRGPVSPAEFVPLLEQTGLILPVGAWVLRAACEAALRWPDPIGVAVNLSPVQFHRGEVLDAVRAALQGTGLAPHRLTLEITEGLLLEHTETVLETLAQLRGMGVAIALDDFGTGYSSLSYLWRFRFDTLKIDRSFVREARIDGKAAAIIETIVGLGHSLDLSITAEGVETEEQLAALSGVGCDGVQGFLLGRPMPADQAEALARDADGAAQRVAA